ncbi:MAG: hypothetical protein Q4B95_02505 [Lonepinella koalarum]|nr:hypothetical protein [Lonepinella koalarum]
MEDILQEIIIASSRLNHIPTQHLPEQIVEPILSGVERKLVMVNGCKRSFLQGTLQSLEKLTVCS